MAEGILLVQVFAANQGLPIVGANVIIQEEQGGERTLQFQTDSSGLTPQIPLYAPSQDLSLVPELQGNLPYALYHVTVEAPGYLPVIISDVPVFAGIVSRQPVELHPKIKGRETQGPEEITIPPSALLQSDRRNPDGPPPSYFQGRILNEVYIPQSITVHLGKPNVAANDVTVSFLDYIKNVASSEIYPTWPDSALQANIHAQVGFVLNRVFTEWYRSRGYSFDITNSTTYDQSFVYGRTIFDNINQLVDEIFNVYPSRQGAIEPLFSSYCNGTTSTCAGLSQWGTVDLARRGYAPLQILQYYYGTNVELRESNDIRGLEESYPDTPLRLGSVSPHVVVVKKQLNRIRRNYPAIPVIPNLNQTFDSTTEQAVRAFQNIFGLQIDGIVGKATWYELSYIYVAVKKLGELNSEGETPVMDCTRLPFPGILLKEGSRGQYVFVLQEYLSELAVQSPQMLLDLDTDGIFGPKTKQAVRAFQQAFGLSPDGIVGPLTWNKMIDLLCPS